jgi:hypothetical protein
VGKNNGAERMGETQRRETQNVSGMETYVAVVQYKTRSHCPDDGDGVGLRNVLLLLLLAFTTDLRVLASSFLRFRDHTQ